MDNVERLPLDPSDFVEQDGGAGESGTPPAALGLPAYGSRVRVGGTRVGTFSNDDRLYCISDDTLFCFDAIGGQLIWRMNLPFSPSTGPLALGTEGDLRVYIGD